MSSEFLHGIIPKLIVNQTFVQLINNTGQFSIGGTLRLFIQGRNRAGYTEPSAAITPIIYTATQAIQISFPTSARNVATDFHYYVISHSPTGNPQDAIALCRWTNYESDQLTPRPLTPITLYRDEHVAQANSVATPTDLPTGIDLLPGMTRLVVGGVPTSAYYQYDPYEVGSPNGKTILQPHSGEKWVRTGSPNVGLITDITDTDGCARPIQAMSADSLILPPTYPADGGTPIKGTPLKLIWRNDSSSVLPAGTAFNLGVKMDGSQASDLFDGKLMVTPRGFVNLANGSLDTSDGLGGTMPDIDGDIPYKYGDRTTLFLYKDLPVGWAYFIEVAAYFTVEQLQGRVLEGSRISISFTPASQAGDAAYAIWKVTGDIVLSDGSRLKVVPGIGLSAKILSGSALIQRFVFPPKGDRAVYGLQPSLSDQQITLDGNGSVFYRGVGTVPGTEAVRAKVSCEVGYSNSLGWSQSIAVDAGSALTITLGYPCDADGNGLVRLDYPHLASRQGRFNPPYVQLFVLRQSDGKIFQLSTRVTVLATQEQTTTVSNLNNALVITTLPDAHAVNFCLFDPPFITLASSAGGSLPADTYSIAAAYYFDGTAISSISHSVDDGCIYEATGTFAELFTHLGRTDNPHNVTADQVINLSENYVTRNTYQTISGEKFFQSIVGTNQAFVAFNQIATNKNIIASQDFEHPYYTFRISTIGRMSWGDGSGQYLTDTNLYRKNAGTLRTDNKFSANAFILKPVNTPPTTGVDEVALFVDANDGKWKTRQANNGTIVELGTASPPTLVGSWRTLTRDQWRNMTREQWKSITR